MEIASESEPVFEEVISAFEKFVFGSQRRFKFEQIFFYAFKNRIGFDLASLKNFFVRLALEALFDFKEFVIEVEDVVSFFDMSGDAVVEFSSSVCVAANFEALTQFQWSAFKKHVEASCAIGLNEPSEGFEKVDVAGKRFIWRKVEEVERMIFVADHSRHFAFANIARCFYFPVHQFWNLYFALSVICFNNFREQDFAFNQLPEGLNSFGGADLVVAKI